MHMKEDSIKTIRQFFLWLADNMMNGEVLTYHEDGTFELLDEDKRTIAEFSKEEGLYVY